MVQFAKWPRPGKVKTRLAKKLGDTKAMQVHVALFCQVVSVLKNTSYRYEVHLDHIQSDSSLKLSRDERIFNDALPPDVSPQVVGDLGAKMAAVLSKAKEQSPIVIVGSDCPTIDNGYISEAFRQLNRHDLVLGPAEDGGYVLIGARRFVADIFVDVSWGGDGVLQQTCDNAARLGYSVASLDQRWDVDDLQDYQRWLAYGSSSD